MIPLGDASRRPLYFPIVTILIIAANTLVFLMELAGGETFINRWSLVPRFTFCAITARISESRDRRWQHRLG